MRRVLRALALLAVAVVVASVYQRITYGGAHIVEFIGGRLDGVFMRRAATPLAAIGLADFLWAGFRVAVTYTDGLWLVSTFALWGAFCGIYEIGSRFSGERAGAIAVAFFALWVAVAAHYSPWLPSDLTQPLALTAAAMALVERRAWLAAGIAVACTFNRETTIFVVPGLIALRAWGPAAVTVAGWVVVKAILHSVWPVGFAACFVGTRNLAYMAEHPAFLLAWASAALLLLWSWLAMERALRPVVAVAASGLAALPAVAWVYELRAYMGVAGLVSPIAAIAWAATLGKERS